MSKDKYTQPEFSLSLLHPRNWGVWLGFGLLAIIVNILPYRLLLSLGRSLGKLGMRYGKSACISRSATLNWHSRENARRSATYRGRKLQEYRDGTDRNRYYMVLAYMALQNAHCRERHPRSKRKRRGRERRIVVLCARS